MSPLRLRVERARLEITQRELAEELGIPQSRISRAENGATRLSREESERAQHYFARKYLERQRSKQTAVEGGTPHA